jgi:hypothetical protein
VITIEGIESGIAPKKRLTVRAGDKTFTVIARIDTPNEVEYVLNGGILQYGTADSISPAARTTIASWNSTGLQVNNGDFRAPIFYDSNNTGYYCDPTGTSNFAGLTVANQISGSVNGYSTYLPTSYAGGQQLNPQTYFSNYIGLKVSMTAVAGYWSDTLWINGYSGGDVLSMCALHTSRQATPRMWISTQASTATSYGTLYEFPTLGYNSGNTAGLYAGILYDSNNTGYYLDPASGGTSLNAAGNLVYGTGGSNTGSFIYHGGGSGDYGVIRFYQAGSNNQTIHVFPTTWQGGSLQSASTGSINLTGVNGVTFGAWNANNGWVDTSGNGQFNGSSRAPIFYDSNDTTYYLDPNGYSQINGNGSVNGSSGVGMSIYSTGGNGTIMAFHRGGYYAINFGLDSDNVIRIGGWSASANRLQMDMSGNLTMAGNVTAYSDIRIKTDILVIENALEKVSKIRGVTFIRTDEGSSDARQSGVIAQEVELVLPEVVSEDASGIKNVAYGNMAGLFIEAIKELKAEIEELKSRIH